MASDLSADLQSEIALLGGNPTHAGGTVGDTAAPSVSVHRTPRHALCVASTAAA
jgi:hypothetical protein